MRADDFIKEQINLAPSINDYLKKGYSEKFATKIVSSFFVEKNKCYSNFHDELLILIDLYNSDIIEIGIITFYDSVHEYENFYVVGEVEADWLIVEKVSGMVKVVEMNSDVELWKCALDGSKFLDAILEVNKFIIKSSLSDGWKDEQSVVCSVSSECGEIAGGKSFRAFYKMLLGCFE
jgi:hypothetical protein